MDTKGTDSQKFTWGPNKFFLIFTLLTLLGLLTTLASCQEVSQGEQDSSPVAGLKEQPTASRVVEQPDEEDGRTITETPNRDTPASTTEATEEATHAPEIEETAPATTPIIHYRKTVR